MWCEIYLQSSYKSRVYTCRARRGKTLLTLRRIAQLTDLLRFLIRLQGTSRLILDLHCLMKHFGGGGSMISIVQWRHLFPQRKEELWKMNIFVFIIGLNVLFNLFFFANLTVGVYTNFNQSNGFGWGFVHWTLSAKKNRIRINFYSRLILSLYQATKF